MQQSTDFLKQAIELAYANVEKSGRPFGALIVKEGKVIAKAGNQIIPMNDPTTHAELLAIRAAPAFGLDLVRGLLRVLLRRNMRREYLTENELMA